MAGRAQYSWPRRPRALDINGPRKSFQYEALPISPSAGQKKRDASLSLLVAKMENIIDTIIDRERNFDTEALAIVEHNFVYENDFLCSIEI